MKEAIKQFKDWLLRHFAYLLKASSFRDLKWKENFDVIVGRDNLKIRIDKKMSLAKLS